MSKRVKVPLPFKDRLKAYGDLTYKQVHAAVMGSVVKDVPIAILRSTQQTVGSEMVAAYSRGEGKTDKPPIVIEYKGRHYIHDGHHRTTNAVQSGERTIRARVARVGPPRPPIRFREHGHAGEFLLMKPEATSVTYREHDIEDVVTMVGDVAVLTIDTPLESKPGSSWWGYFDDYESILCRFRNAIEDGEVKSILLKIDSPGGAAQGLNECVDAMIALKKKSGKRVVTFADEGAYSAAYAIACVGDELYLPRAGGLGSIGVVSCLVDYSEANAKHGIRVEVITSGKRKADGNPNVPMSDGARAHVQRRVDSLAKLFFGLVAKSRHMHRADVRALEADTFYGKKAVKRGLADDVLSLADVLEKMTLDNCSLHGSSSRKKRADSPDSRGAKMKTIKELAAAYLAAQKAGDHVKTKAAHAALHAALTGPAAPRTSKKVVTTETKSTESSSSSSSGSSESSESESESESSGSSSEESEEHESESVPSMTESSSSSGSSESESEEDDKMSEKTLSAMVKKLTGKTSTREAIGALAALAENASAAPKMSKRLAKLEAVHQGDKVEKLIAKGKADGKITPGNEKNARGIAKEYGHRALRSHIEGLTKVSAATDYEPEEDLGEGVVLSAPEKKILLKMGIKESDLPKHAKALAAEKARLAAKGNR